MIRTFPDPYEGELLYSVLARFVDRMRYGSQGAALFELFGARHAVPAVELQNQIQTLVSALPLPGPCVADTLIQNHTLLPLYAPFLPEENLQLIIKNMKGDGVRTTQLRSGISAGRIN